MQSGGAEWNAAWHIAAHHGIFFRDCNLQNAIDFAEAAEAELKSGMVGRNAARYSAWQALHLSPNF
jgi:hypothetical protein